jgi:hypothetical protein
MNPHQLMNLRKAARAGLSWSNDPDTWHRGIEAIAKAQARPGETVEQAYARVIVHDDDARAMMQMYAAARDAAQVRKAGRPRAYDVGVIKRSDIEKQLSDLAMKRATVEGISYEMAFGRVLDTPEGANLYALLRNVEAAG